MQLVVGQTDAEVIRFELNRRVVGEREFYFRFQPSFFQDHVLHVVHAYVELIAGQLSGRRIHFADEQPSVRDANDHMFIRERSGALEQQIFR